MERRERGAIHGNANASLMCEAIERLNASRLGVDSKPFSQRAFILVDREQNQLQTNRDGQK